MAGYSDDSSDNEKKLFHQTDNKVSPVKGRKSEKVIKARGIVVSNRNSSERSPKKRNNSELAESPSKKETRKNYALQSSSDEEQIAAPNTANIKVEQFSSDAESDVITYKSPNANRVRNNLFDDRDDKIVVEDPDESVIATYDAQQTRDSLSQHVVRQPTKQRRIYIKKEIVSSEDDETPGHKDSDKFISERVVSPRKYETKVKSSEQRAGNSSESEIEPSQYWLHQYKDVEKIVDEKGSSKLAKKSSPVKFSNADEIVDKKKRASVERKESLQRKLPSKITKMEIINTKYERIDKQIVKDEGESCFVKDGHGDEERNKGKGAVGFKDDNDNDEKSKEFQDGESSRNLDTEKVLLEKEISPGNKRQIRKKTQASPKRKLSSESKIPDKGHGIEVKSNIVKKDNLKPNLDSILNDRSAKMRLSICDSDTTEDEEKEKCIETKKMPRNFALALKKPSSNKKNTKANGTQMVLVLKSNDQIRRSNEYKSHSSSDASVSHQDDLNNKHSSDDSLNNVASSSMIKKKVSAKKKRQNDNDVSEKAVDSIKKKATSPKKQTIKQRKSTELVSKRKLDLDDGSDNEEASKMNSPKAKLSPKKKYSENNEGNSPGIESNKRAKLMSLAKQAEPEPEQELEPENEMFDSDDTDSLTKLNTTLNKSMALMKNESEAKKSKKSMKSVSINTKQNLTHVPNDSRTQKSILKKPESITTNDTQELTVQSINVSPQIMKRPLNLQNLKDQESLTYDSTKASFELEDISDNDEIYILDVPRTVDPREFKGQTLRLGGKSKLQIRDQLYETCSKEATHISCVFRTDGKDSSYQTVNLRPAGCINIRQKLSKSLHIELSPLEKRTVPFPENLKIRHPLFGADYKDKIVSTAKKVPKKIQKSAMKEEFIVKTHEPSQIDGKQMKSKNVGKHKNQNIESSQELNESKNNFTHKVGKSRKLHSNDSESNDSDSDESFFQKVKRENIEKPAKRKKSKNLLSILKLNQTADLPVMSDEEMITIKKKQLSVNKTLGLSLDSSTMRNDSFDNAKDSEFFSSTPIKFENDEKNYDSGILPHKVRKRKTHDDAKGTLSVKKVKKN